MLHYISFLNILFSWFILPFSTKEITTDEIAWKAKRKLTWDDFRAKANENDPLHALTATNIDMKAKCEDGKLKVKVESVFSTGESWTKTRKSDKLLFHEQLHFDITEIYARRLRKELSSVKNICDKPEQINLITDRVFEEWKKQEDFYDKETNHGLNYAQMDIWAKKIEAELKQLEAYQED